MKKFLVILMVVAMASFLFVGCMPSVTPPVDDEEDEDVGVKTDTPYITGAGDEVSILATTTQYITAAGDLEVSGVGVAGAIIKLYIGDAYAGIGYTDSGGAFADIGITGITLTEGAKKFHVTATLPGLAESDASTEYAFTYDKTKPTIVSVVGDSSSEYITVTFSEPVDADTVADATWKYFAADSIYVGTVISPSAVVVPSATTARLLEAASGTGFDLVNGYFLKVECSDKKIEDLAGNEMDIPVTVYGFVVP